MFLYQIKKVEIKNGNVLTESKAEREELSEAFHKALERFESSSVQDLKNQQKPFPYALGKIKSKNKNDFCVSNSERNFFLLTHHQQYIGSKIFNFFLDYISTKENIIVTFEEEFSSSWQESKITYRDLISALKILLTKVNLISDLKFYVVIINGNSRFKLAQVNEGSSKPLYKIKTDE